MLTPADFITVPYPQDLTRAGLEYALRSLVFGRVLAGPDALRQLVALRAGELALRRGLDELMVPYELAHITDPLAPQILLDGKRVVLQVTVIDNRNEIRQAIHDPAKLLEIEAVLPEETALPEEDLILQACALALVAHSDEETRQAQKAGQPAALVRPLPSSWSQNHTSSGLGRLALKTETGSPVEITLGGSDENLDFQSERVQVIPLERAQTNSSFQSMAYVQADGPVEGRLAVRSPVLNETQVILPLDWHNLWLYGMKIIFLGALPVREMRRLMTLNLRKSLASQKIRAVELNPLSDYFP